MQKEQLIQNNLTIHQVTLSVLYINSITVKQQIILFST